MPAMMNTLLELSPAPRAVWALPWKVYRISVANNRGSRATRGFIQQLNDSAKKRHPGWTGVRQGLGAFLPVFFCLPSVETSMAKKQAAETAEKKPDAPAEAKEGKDAKEAKEPKAPKGEGKKAKARAAPTAPPAEKKPAAAPADSPAAPAPASGATAPSPTATEPGKKKKRAGVPPARGKKLRNQLKNQLQKLTKEGALPLARAVQELKKLRRAKFDETVEIHMWLGVDMSQSDQLVRGTVPLPHGVGKAVRVVVFCQGDNIKKAKEAGADFAGSDDLLEKIQKQ